MRAHSCLLLPPSASALPTSPFSALSSPTFLLLPSTHLGQQPLHQIEIQACLPSCFTVSCAGMISDAAFKSEMLRSPVEPASPQELLVAQRSLVRYEKQGPTDDEFQVCANEDWVRLYVALRRALPHDTRITPGILRQWKSKVASSTSVKESATSWRRRPLMLCPSTRRTWTSGSSPRMSWCSRLTSILRES